MYCPNCGTANDETANFCTECGRRLERRADGRPRPAPVYEESYEETPAPQVVYVDRSPKLITPWGYVGYRILYSLPLIGLICLLFDSFDKNDPNSRNYARSYFCMALVVIGIIIAASILGFSEDVVDSLLELISYL